MNYTFILVSKPIKQSDGSYRYYCPDLIPVYTLFEGAATYLSNNPINIWNYNGEVYALVNDTTDSNSYLFKGIK